MNRWIICLAALALALVVLCLASGDARGSDALVDRVHTTLRRMPPAQGDTETAEERSERLLDAAEALVEAAGGDRAVVAALITIGVFESHWSQLVAEGRCSEYRYKCDHDPRTGKPRALSNFQLWAGACPELHDADGPPDIGVAARCAARLWRYGRARCGSDAGAFALYGTGRGCSTASAERRAAFMERVLAGL